MSRRTSVLPALLALALALATVACGNGQRSPAPSLSAATTPPASSTPVASPPSTAATPTTWAALGTATPLSITGNRPGLSADPAHPEVLAYCAPGSVQLSRDGGTTWTPVPTAGVVAATAKSPYPVKTTAGQGAPTCRTVVADAAHKATIYASFDAGDARSGMPPIFNAPVYTTDGGAHWSIVPSPAGLAAGGFGQFAVSASGGGVNAIFGRIPGTTASVGPAFGVVTTADGGATWTPGALACPAQGPCLAWGPAASGHGSCSMHPYAQPVETSADRGKTWTASSAPAGAPLPILVNGCAPNLLIALSPTRVALVSNGPVEPADALRVSDDSGKTWTNVALPALPGDGATTQALQMLPDGSLLAPVFVQLTKGTFGSRVALLRAGAKAWCTVAGVTVAGANTDPTTLQAAGGRLWWVENGGGAGATAKGVPLSRVHC